MTMLFLVSLRQSFRAGGMDREDLSPYVIPLYLGTMTLWMLASLSLAKAKGYGGDTMGKIFIMLFFIGYCCPGALFIFPLLGFFIKDKTHQSKRRSRRRRTFKHDRLA